MPVPSRRRRRARARAPRPRSPPCPGRRRPSGSRAVRAAASRQASRISRPGVTVATRSAASASLRVATRPPTRSATARARASSRSHTSGARPRAANVRAAASPFTPAPTTAAVSASCTPERLRRKHGRRTRAHRRHRACIEHRDEPPVLGRRDEHDAHHRRESLRRVAGERRHPLQERMPDPSAGIARKSPAGYAGT